MNTERQCAKCPALARPNRTTCVECAKKTVAQAQRYRLAKIAKGECGWAGCDIPPATGRTLCQEHLETLRAANAKRNRERKQQGLCRQCGRPSELGQVHCLLHRKVRQEGNLPTPVKQSLREHRERLLVQQKVAAAKAQWEFVERHLGLIANPRTQSILRMRYQQDMTLEEVGRALGISRERVRQIQTWAENKIAMYTLEKDIPIPVRGTGVGAEIRETLKAMEVGDSFVLPNTVHTRATLGSVAKSMGLLVTSRKVSDIERRVWLVSKNGHGGSA